MVVLGAQKEPRTLHSDNMLAQTPDQRPATNTRQAHSHQQPGSLGILVFSEPPAQLTEGATSTREPQERGS